MSKIATPSSPTTMTMLHIEYAKATNTRSDTWITRGSANASWCFARRELTEGFGGSMAPAVAVAASRIVAVKSLAAWLTELLTVGNIKALHA
ncbi:MAG: hypothetical protein ABGY42_03735 [bacterium]